MPNATPASGAAGRPQTRQAVYDTAVRLFARNGFAATGMRELSREAGVNLATVNYFYGSKKGLLKAILEDYFTGVLEILSENFAGDEPVDVRLRRTVAAVARYFGVATDKLMIALTELPKDDPDITDFKAEWFARLHGVFQSGLGDAASRVPAGIVGPAVVGLVASRFLLRPVVSKVLPSDELAAAEAAYPELIAELFVNGFNGLLAARREGRDV